MKKAISVLLATVILLSTVVFGTTTFADEGNVIANTNLSNYIENQTKNAAKKLFGSSTFSVAQAADFYTYLKSGADVGTSVKDSFVDSVKSNLDANSGKLLNGDKEDAGLYGAVILCLTELGYDTTNFEGYNLNTAFENIPNDKDTGIYISNVYYYRLAVKAAGTDLAKTLCKQFIDGYYTMGKGANYWGYSCDNTAMFLAAIAPYASDFTAEYNDALALIATYQTNNGAYYCADYGTYANSDSTALSLMAYTLANDSQNAWNCYSKLIKNFEVSTGLFAYTSDYSDYSTKDALIALEYYSDYVKSNNIEHPAEVCKSTVTKATTTKNGNIKNTCIICGKISNTAIGYPKNITLSTIKYTYNGKDKKPSVKVTSANGGVISSANYSVSYPTSTKNVGKYCVTVKFKGNYSGTVKKYFVINPKGTSVKSTTAKKHGFTVKWAKQSTQTTGYQIKYSAYASMKNCSVYTVKKSSATSQSIAGLKQNKKYYVQVRTYKTVNGTKYYSAWSSIKTVKTK